MPDPSRSGEEVETLRDYRDIELWKDVTEAQARGLLGQTDAAKP